MTNKCNEMPEWAEKLEAWGKKMENKCEGKEKSKENPKPPKWERKGEFVGDFLGNLLALFIVNYAPIWFPGFFTDSYVAVLAVFNAVIIATALIYLFLIIYSPKWFYLLAMAATNALAIVSLTTLLSVFPLNIPYGLEFLFKMALIIATIVVIISVLVYFLRFVYSLVQLDGYKYKKGEHE